MTDVEKLAEVIHDAVLDIDQHMEGPDIEALAEWLFEHGVRAPEAGGDDE